MKYHFTYLRNLLHHKWLVILEGRALGLPLLQLLIHDWSKFLPDEWLAGVAFLRNGEANRTTLQKHYRRNRHHPQHWFKGVALPMPERFCLEMLADWRAVGRTKSGNTLEWYQTHGCKFPFHPSTRAWVENALFSSETKSLR